MSTLAEMGRIHIIPLKLINNVAILKLSWTLLTLNNSWAYFYRSRFFRNDVIQNKIWSLPFSFEELSP